MSTEVGPAAGADSAENERVEVLDHIGNRRHELIRRPWLQWGRSQSFEESVGWDGGRMQVALPGVASQSFQCGSLRFEFDALSHDSEPERMGETDHVPHDLVIDADILDTFDELPVELDDRQWYGAEV